MKQDVTVLSVRQPWAWLIMQGFKPIENRTWRTNYRGKLYIHAGKLFDLVAPFCLSDSKEMQGLGTMLCKHFGILFGDSPESSSITKSKNEFGAIIGLVNLTATFNPKLSLPPDLQKWAEPDCWHWKVENPVSLAPIPMRGQLGLFKAEIEVPE